MIKEIKNPFDTFLQYSVKKRIKKKIVKKIANESSNNLTVCDVDFKRDPTLVEDFSKKCDIDKELAETILRAFFEEIKKILMDGCILSIKGFGKFYINGPHRVTGIKPDIDHMHSFYPKFKPASCLKDKFMKIEKGLV